ncbi:GxxExxY protein [bacterium]|nr:GxxExxY protein [bacterium]
MESPIKFKETTSLIINCFFNVYNELGYGFLEKVYQNAMFIELKAVGFNIFRELPIRVYFKGNIVGEFFADFVVNQNIIVELKAAESIVDSFHSQLLNYLKATNIELGLLLNFGHKPQFIRKIFTNDKKKHLAHGIRR